jgi:DNA-binding winged helix-turn-helix (wHTH) protein
LGGTDGIGRTETSCDNGGVIARFDDVEVDFDRVEIRRGGVPVPVQPQVFTVIAYLVERTDRVVSKEELLDNIWGDRFVSESALTSRIKSARRALGDDGVAQRVIRTVQGRGYRFVAALRSDGSDEPAQTGLGNRQPFTDARPSFDRASSTERTWPFVGRHDEVERVRSWYADEEVRGVVVAGPGRIGRSRFAVECARTIGGHGVRVEHVVGSSSSADISLAAMAHLLPPDVLDTAHTAADLARASVLRRAHAAFDATSSNGPRPVLVVDDVHDLDPMSGTLLTALFATGSAFGVVVGPRRSGEDSALGGLERDERFRHLTLEPLDEVDVDILLYRVLEGPIDAESLLELYEASQGRPGLLRDVVDASEHGGVLRSEAGVWRLIGQPVSRTMRDWPVDGITADAIEAAELLALFTRLEIGLCDVLMDGDALEELDRRRLLDVATIDGVQFVQLADPLLAGVVIESIGPLRLRRLKQRLTAQLAGAEPDPATLATLVSWGSEFVEDLDPDSIRAAALAAMLGGDLRAAEALVGSLAPTDDPYVGMIRSELAVRFGQWALAEEVLATIDVDRLDDLSASLVLRRRAAVQFVYRRDHAGAIEWLAHEAAIREGSVARALEIRRLGLLSMCGRYREVLDAAVYPAAVRGVTAIELQVALGTAQLGRGAIDEALILCEAASNALERVPAAWSVEPRDGVGTLHCSALLQGGDLRAAAVLARAYAPPGKHSGFAFLPALAAEIEMELGRPWAAREVLRTAIASSARHTRPQWLDLAEAVFVRTDVELGRFAGARDGLDAAFAALPATSGPLRWRLLRSIGELSISLGVAEDALGPLLDEADEAERIGATLAAADLLCMASLVDSTPETAGLVAERIEHLASGFGGTLWPVRVAHVGALRAGRGLDEIVRRYEAIGFVRLAAQAGRAGRHRL